MKIGVFGGSFDPPHLSHVAICSFTLALTDVDEIVVVPCFEHALSKELTAFEHRLKMCELAFDDLRRTTVSAIERELGGTSYTLRTLKYLKTKRERADLALIVGADAVRDKGSWYRFDEIQQLAQLIPFARRGVDVDASLLPAPPEMSATEIRSRLQHRLNVEDQVPRRVLHYVEDHGLYNGNE
jgi:nicotinate-nucleotide adenylyltransferase